jgi:hypothetical protein
MRKGINVKLQLAYFMNYRIINYTFNHLSLSELTDYETFTNNTIFFIAFFGK